MGHYEVGEGDFLGLALALAKDHVPGFKVIRNAPLRLRHRTWGAVIHANRGRQLKWTPEELSRFLKYVEETKKKKSRSTDLEALKIIAQNGEWGRPTRSNLDQWVKTLQNQLALARAAQNPEN
jgi:hypothetical protein